MIKKRSEFFDTNFVYFVILSLFVAIRIISSTFAVNTVWSYILNAIIQVGLAFSLPVFLYSYLRKQKVKTTLNQYGFRKINFKSVVISLCIGILVYVATVFISTFFSMIITYLGYEKTGSQSTMTEYPVWLLILELFTTAVLPGICEETANRGMLINGFRGLGAKKAIILSGLLFGLMHLNIEQFFYATILGFYFGFIAMSTESIYPSMIMHFCNNAISVITSFAIVNNLPIGSYLSDFIGSIVAHEALVGILLLFVVMFVLTGLLLFLTKALIKESKITKITNFADTVIKTQLRNQLLMDINPNLEIKKDEEIENVEVQKQTIGNRELYSINMTNQLLPYKQVYHPKGKDKVFVFANLFMGFVLTICTFIWGIL